MSEKQQTAVEWLVSEIEKTDWWLIRKKIPLLLEQAKEMEKQQIQDAFNNGFSTTTWDKDKENKSEKYYSKTYSK